MDLKTLKITEHMLKGKMIVADESEVKGIKKSIREIRRLIDRMENEKTTEENHWLFDKEA